MDEIFKLFKSKSSIIIFSIILISIKAYYNPNFVDLLKLSNGEYFIILDKGFYIYDKNLILNKTIYIFHPQLYTYYTSKISEYLFNDEIYIIGFYDYGYYSNEHYYCKNYSLYIYNYKKQKFNLSTYLYEKYRNFQGDYLNTEVVNLYNVKFDNLNVNVSKIYDYINYGSYNRFYYESYCYNLKFFGQNNSKLIGDCKSNCIIFPSSSTIRCFYNKYNYLFNIKYNINSSEIFADDNLNNFQKSE